MKPIRPNKIITTDGIDVQIDENDYNALKTVLYKECKVVLYDPFGIHRITCTGRNKKKRLAAALDIIGKHTRNAPRP